MLPRRVSSLVMVSVLVWLGGCTARPPALRPARVPAPPGPGHLQGAGPAPVRRDERVTSPPASPDAGPSEAGPPETVVLGRSVEGRPLLLHRFSRWGGGTLVIGGIHGNEPTSAEVAERLVGLLGRQSAGRDETPVAVLPRANPDGLARGTRVNANGVDLNRNFAAANWTARRAGHGNYGGPRPESEPETRAILRAVAMTAPARIISIHSIRGGRECNNFDGPAEYLARAMSAENGYPVVASLGPCRGSLGNWAGVDRDVPIITLELPRDQPGPAAWARNRSALLAAIRPDAAAARPASRPVEPADRTTYHETHESSVKEPVGGE